MTATVTPKAAYVVDGKLVQEFEYIDGPNKGGVTRLITLRRK